MGLANLERDTGSC